MKTTLAANNSNENNGRGRGHDPLNLARWVVRVHRSPKCRRQPGASWHGQAGTGFASLDEAFDRATVKAIESGATSTDATAAADYQFVKVKAIHYNLHLIGNGCPSFWRDGGWEPAMQDAIQAAMLDLQLWRRKLRLVRDDSGADKIDAAASVAASAAAVVWGALRRSMRANAGAGVAYEAKQDNHKQYETWRQAVCEDGGEGESTAERTARRARALPDFLAQFIGLQTGTRAAAYAGTPSGLAAASRRKREEFAAMLARFIEALNNGVPCEQAARGAGFRGYGVLADAPQGATQTLIRRLKKYGFNIPDASWRVKLPRVRRWFKRPQGGAAA